MRHVALLRAINIGGKRGVPMEALRAVFTELGARDVVTYIQSGNVVYVPPARKKLGSEALAAAIEARFGFAVPVVLRSAEALERTFTSNPFLRRGEDRKHAHVAFLSAAPKLAAIDAGARSPGDEAAIVADDLYLHFPNGVGKSKVTTEWMDRTLGVTSTVRNWNTVERLLELSR